MAACRLAAQVAVAAVAPEAQAQHLVLLQSQAQLGLVPRQVAVVPVLLLLLPVLLLRALLQVAAELAGEALLLRRSFSAATAGSLPVGVPRYAPVPRSGRTPNSLR